MFISDTDPASVAKADIRSLLVYEVSVKFLAERVGYKIVITLFLGIDLIYKSRKPRALPSVLGIYKFDQSAELGYNYHIYFFNA